MAYEKPLPDVTAEDRPFWDAAKQHRFVLPRCKACGNVWYPAYRSCPKCLSFDREFVQASGRGTVWGCTIMRQPYVPGYRDEMPYNVVLVELEEGPIVCSNLVGVPLEKIRPGIAVEAFFDDVTEDFTLIRFKPR
jgi:uncharacterized OB-fold protein